MSRVALRSSFCAIFVLTLAQQSASFQDDLEEQARRAKAAMLSRHYLEAAEIYRRMSAELPEEPGIRFNLALSLHSMGHYRESTQTLEGIRATQGNNPKFWFLLGEGYLNLEEPGKAIAPLIRAAELDPSNVDASLELAGAWLEDGQFAKSEKAFRILSAQHPDLPKVWTGLALSQSGLARDARQEEERKAYARSAREATAQLAALPESAEQHEMLARIYSDAGQRTEAISELKAAEKLSPRNPRIESDLARNLVANREYEQATLILRGLLTSDPDNSGEQFELGDALLETGKTEEAVEHLKKAVQLQPALLPAQAKLGEALLRIGSAQAALPHLELAAQIDKDGSIHFQLANVYRRLGRRDLANKAMARSVELQTKTKAAAP